MIKKFFLKRNFQTEILSNNEVRPINLMPGPKGFLGLGTILNYVKPFGSIDWDQLHILGMERYKKYGPIVCEKIMPGASVVWLYDPVDISKVLTDTPGNLPCRRSHLALEKFRYDRPEVYSSGGLLPTNGEKWWELRSQFQKHISSPKNVRNILPSTNQVTREFIEMLASKFDANNTIQDMVTEFDRFSFEMTCLIAFDERMYSFSESERHPNSISSRLIKAGDDTSCSVLSTDNDLQLWRLFETASYRKLRVAQEYMQQIAIDFVDKRAAKQTDGDSLLDQYLKNPNLSKKDLIGISSDFLLAGVHTVSFSSAFALYHIAKNKRVQELMHEEAIKVLPSNESEITTPIMNNEIPYTRAVLKEVFRLNPISIGVGRISNQDMVLGGYLIPKNTRIVTQNYISCRLDEYFPKPLQFIPERWIKINREKSNINPYLVIPFGQGMRSCIARRFAEQTMLVFLLRLLREYKIEWKGIENLGILTKLINRPNSDVTIKFEKRF
ncbi:hypothetical protein PVAND_006877 [Polypedilum vanderplanki]|uniref:Cytochrome P450 302a1, mitochondrial-like n=1 Tax=Polypedilum vanderplanki TaxID=319348 RepID=A0A9J6C664_POLVA|nr:hypothetical protein PVAND_006877 [Polypedilum vanderplanki]